MALLDPKLDVVFKLPFAEPRNRSLLAAVLRTTSPIAEVTVLEPELPKDLVLDRGVRLDLLVQLEDGRLVDVEMQCDPRGNRGDRWLYHWARLFAGRLRRGDESDALEPVVAIVFLDDAEPSGRFHSVYEVLEVHEHARLNDAPAAAPDRAASSCRGWSKRSRKASARACAVGRGSFAPRASPR